MDCQDVATKSADHLAGTLSDGEMAEVARHLDHCASCREEFAALDDTWQLMGEVAEQPRDSAAMRDRFAAALAGYQHAMADHARAAGTATRSSARWWQVAAAAAVLVAGVFLGRYTAAPAAAGGVDSQVAVLRGELSDMRQILTLSLLQQQSASERLKGVSWTSQIDQPGSEVVTALLDTLMHDENVNVRLATIDALQRFAERDVVRRGALAALPAQASPLVQIALIDFVAAAANADTSTTLRALAHDATVNAAVRARATRALQQLGEPL